MKKRRVFRLLHLAALLAATGCFLVLGNFQSAGLTTKPQGFEARVVTALPKLEITNIKQLSDDIVEVTIKNGYEKSVTAVASMRGKSSYRRDYLCAEFEEYQKLAPGASDKFSYPFSPSKGEDLVVCSVLFSDLTSEGNHNEVMGILHQRLGEKVQFGRIKPYLARLSKLARLSEVDSSQIREELKKIRQVAESLPIEIDGRPPESSDIHFGLKTARTMILRDLAEVEAELDKEEVFTSYATGQPQNIHDSGLDKFRRRFARMKDYFTGYESRL